MTSGKFPTKVVHVDIEPQGPELYFATSKDLAGFFVAKKTIEELFDEIPLSIASLYEACGESVIVEQVYDINDSPAWVTMPIVAAKAALERR